MSIEFSPNEGRADIISSMAEANEAQKPKRPNEKEKSEDLSGLTSRQRIERFLGLRDSFSSSREARIGGMSTPEAKKIAENATPAQIVFQTEIPLHGDINFPVTVERRQDGTLVMNDLPSTKYDFGTVTKIIEGVGVTEKVELPNDWEGKSKQEKKNYLRDKFGIDTLVPSENVVQSLDKVQERAERLLEQGHLRENILELWNYLDEPTDPTALILKQEIEGIISSEDPFILLPAEKELRDLRQSFDNNPRLRAEFDRVIPLDWQVTLFTAKQNLDADFQQRMDATPLDSRAAVSDIDRIAQTELGGLKSGWRNIEDASRDLVATALRRPDLRGADGFRLWYAYKQIETLTEAQDIYERTQVKPDVQDNIRTVEVVSRFFEKSKTPENFNLARDNLNRLLQAIELSDDPEVSLARKEQIRKRLDAFEVVNSFLIRLDQTEGDPEQLLNVARNFVDETWYYFYDRFNPNELVDSEGRKYMIRKTGEDVDINILSEAQNAFTYQYFVDRYRTNQVQLWMKSNLSIQDALNLDNGIEYQDRRWLIEELIKGSSLLPQGFTFESLKNDPDLSARLQSELDEAWQDGTKRKKLVQRWYEETTFVGADGYADQIDAGGKTIKRKRLDIWQDKIIDTVLRRRLVKADVDPERINSLLTDADLIGAVKRNGYDLAKYVYSDSLDKLEYTDPEGRHKETFFGEETPYLARVVTSFMDFCLTESQGDERVNGVVMDHLAKQWLEEDEERRPTTEGWLLPQNMTAFRILGQGENKLLPSTLKTAIDDKIKEEQKRKKRDLGVDEVPGRDVAGYVMARQIFEGINPEEPDSSLNEEFTKIDWSLVSREMKRFDIADMLEDRFKSNKWFMEKGGFRTWLNHPTGKEFLDMTQGYYSMRNVRKHPGSADYLEMQWEAGQHWEEWFGYKENLTNAEMEGYVQQAKELNLIDEDRGEKLKHRLLGRLIERNIRQLAEALGMGAKTTLRSPGWWAGHIVDLIKYLYKYLMDSLK